MATTRIRDHLIVLYENEEDTELGQYPASVHTRKSTRQNLIWQEADGPFAYVGGTVRCRMGVCAEGIPVLGCYLLMVG